MLRFLVSLLAGGLVIAGAWLGWSRTTDVDAAIAATVDRAVDETPPGERPEAHAGRSAGTDAASSVGRHDRRTPAGEPLRTDGVDPGPSCSTPGPRDAAGMTRLIAQLDGEPTLEGADHGGSVALADGRRMFVFGDTVRDPQVVSPFMVRNSVLVAKDGCVKPMSADDDGAVIPDDGDHGYWPMSLRATTAPGGTKVQVITNTVRDLGHRDFETSGSNLATFEVPTNRMPRLVSHEPLGERTTDPRVPTWGAAMWDADGWTYLFGTASDATKSTAGWSLHVARTRPDALADPSAWEYWDGSTWVAGDRSAAQGDGARLIPSDDGVSHVLSVIRRDGAWYAVSKEGDFTGSWLTVWKAESVTGPWTKHRVRRLTGDTRTLRYTPLAHPDIAVGRGRLLVSWCESPTSEADYRSDPSRYRPRYTEIELP